MNIIFYNLVVAIVGLAVSPFVVALIKRYSNEEKIFERSFIKDVKFDTRVSLMIPLIWIALLYYHGIGFNFVLNAFVSVLLVISFFVDIKAQIIPNETNFIGFIVGIALAYFYLTQDYILGINKLLGIITGTGIFLLIALLAVIIYRKVGMGMGDVKLMGMLGLFFGFENIIQIFVFSFLIGAVVSIFLLITKIKKADDYIPFGPFIVIASFITMFLSATTTSQWLIENLVY